MDLSGMLAALLFRHVEAVSFLSIACYSTYSLIISRKTKACQINNLTFLNIGTLVWYNSHRDQEKGSSCSHCM